MSEENENFNEIDQIAQEMVRVCEEKKAADIVLFHVEEQSILADYYLVCCGLSMPHIRALADAIRRRMLDAGLNCRSQEGTPNSQWIILDYGVVLIHIMTPAMRRHYTLEELWDKRLIVYQGGEELPPASEMDDEPGDFYADEDDEEDDSEEDGIYPFDDEDDAEELSDEDIERNIAAFDDEAAELLFDDDEDEDTAPRAPAEESEEDREFRNKLFGGEAPTSGKKPQSLDDLFGKK